MAICLICRAWSFLGDTVVDLPRTHEHSATNNYRPLMGKTQANRRHAYYNSRLRWPHRLRQSGMRRMALSADEHRAPAHHRERELMGHREAGDPARLVALIAGVVLILGSLSLASVWIATNRAGRSSTVAPSLPPAGVIGEASATRAPSPTVRPATIASPPTVPPATSTPVPINPSITAAPSVTPPAPTATVAPPPTGVVATSSPTVAAATPMPAPNLVAVTVEEAFVRDGPSVDSSIIGGVVRGDELLVVGSSDSWYLIRISRASSPGTRIEGNQGWIAQTVVSPPGQPVPPITP